MCCYVAQADLTLTVSISASLILRLLTQINTPTYRLHLHVTVHTGKSTGHDVIAQWPYKQNTPYNQNETETIASLLQVSLRYLSRQCGLRLYTDFQQH